MSEKIIVKHKFDGKRMRHYLNEELSVFHCHHYITLFTQLAIDAELFKGTKMLFETSEETFYKVLTKYYKTNNISTLEEKINIAEQYYAYIGLGKVKIKIKNESSAEVEMPYSHIDEGWIKKWGKRKNFVNFVGQGFLSAVLSAATDNDIGVFETSEIQSIVCGAKTSKFFIKKKGGN